MKQSTTNTTTRHDNKDYIHQLQEVANKAPRIELTILSSASLAKESIIQINALGLMNGQSLRSAQDGYTFFGCKKNIKEMDAQSNVRKEVVNDFVIQNKNEETAEKHRGRHFQIFFDIPSSQYLIKDLGVGYGVFVKINAPVVLKDNHLVNIGESYLVVNLLRDTENDD